MAFISRHIFRALGFLYVMMSRLPLAGDSMIRGIGLGLASLFRHSPYAIGQCADMAEFRRGFERMIGLLGLSAKVLGHDDSRLEVVVESCPYGFSGPGHRGVCEVAMEMDKTMAGFSRMRLEVDESMPEGAERCRMTFYMMDLT